MEMHERFRGLAGIVLATGLVLGLMVAAPAAASTLKIATSGDISDVDLHMTTH